MFESRYTNIYNYLETMAIYIQLKSILENIDIQRKHAKCV